MTTPAQQHAMSMQQQVRAAIDENGVSLSVSRVGAIYSDGSLNLQRQGNQRADETWPMDDSPTRVIDPSQNIVVGDFVLTLHYGGNALVLGRLGKETDENMSEKFSKVVGGTITGNTRVSKPNPRLELTDTGYDSRLVWRLERAGYNFELKHQEPNGSTWTALSVRSSGRHTSPYGAGAGDEVPHNTQVNNDIANSTNGHYNAHHAGNPYGWATQSYAVNVANGAVDNHYNNHHQGNPNDWATKTYVNNTVNGAINSHFNNQHR